jgi:putative oxidoreductase
MIEKFFHTEMNWVLTLLRITLGLVMLPHGLQKLFGWFGGFGFTATVGFFQSQGIPVSIALLVILAESFGALSLIFGFATKFCAFGIGLTMLGAAIFVRSNGFFMNWFNTQSGEGFEYHLLTIALSLVLLIEGGGTLSQDLVLFEKIK